MSEHDGRSKKRKREAEVYRRGVGKTYPGVGDSFAGVGDTFPGIGTVPLVGETFPGLDVGGLFAGEESSVAFGDLQHHLCHCPLVPHCLLSLNIPCKKRQ